MSTIDIIIFILIIIMSSYLERSFLICIGIDKFRNRDIPHLDYSQTDSYRIQRACHVFNIANNASLLLNENAYKSNILKSIRQIGLKTKRLYVYISSHGDAVNNAYYIYTYDTEIVDIANTALSLDFLLQILNQTSAKQIIVVIDACKIRSSRKINEKITLYCPNTDITFEDTKIQQSIFTKAIIRFLSRYLLHYFNKSDNTRYQKIRQNLFKLLERHRVIYIQGDSGLGKSYFLRQIEKKEQDTFYISIPKLDGITYDIVLTLLSERLSLSHNDKYYHSVDANPERHIRFYTNLKPYCLIIIDHFDHLDEENACKLRNFLEDIPATKLIASRFYTIKVQENQLYHFPNLTKNDIKEFLYSFKLLNNQATKSEMGYSCRNYIDLLNYVYNLEQASLNSKKSISLFETKKIYKAIAVSGGFINKALFSHHFKLDLHFMHQLIDKGLIIEHESFFYPHDAIYSEDISENELNQLIMLSHHYWRAEIINKNRSSKAVHSYILLLKTFDFTLDNNDIDFYQKIIKLLKGRQNTYYLLILYNYFLKQPLPLILLVLMCESLIEIGKFNEASELLSLSKINTIVLSELSIELLWWQGKFQECIDTATLLLDIKEYSKQVSLLCARGIGYFFLGYWDKSSSDLIQVIKIAPNLLLKQRYLSFCVLATIQGIRGTDFASCVSNFIEAINIAKAAGKISWLALIYGNIGEILWKSHFLEQSIETLNIAKQLAYLTDNEPLLLEINRNLLHALHRNRQNEMALAQLKELEENLTSESDSYVKMQIINTLITHFLFNKDIRYKLLISEAIKLTRNNNEYYIYTLSNSAIIQLIEDNNFLLASQTMSQALDLCNQGQNWLAMKQCLDDWDRAIEAYGFNYPLSQSVFQKWHQLLQKELLPYLHHLLNLYEFLQQH